MIKRILASILCLTVLISVPFSHCFAYDDFAILSADDYSKALGDVESITYKMLTSQSPDEITASLNFVSKGSSGSVITYTTDDSSVITESGRVVRPVVGESDKKVTVVATAKHGEETASKEFTFTVKAEEPLYDPMDMPDEDFFGVYDKSTGLWTNKGVFDYDYTNELANLEAVKNAVIDGDYQKAKAELLTYMKNRKPGYVKTKSRNTLLANAACTDFVSKATLLGSASVGSEWNLVEVPIPVGALSIETPLSLDLVALYNEASMAEIKTHESGTSPVLRLTVNGKTTDFEATDDGYIRLGAYSGNNYGKEESMFVKLQGADLGDETYRSKIKFDISSLETLSGVTSAKLIFNARASLVNNEEKQILIIKSYSSLWDEETLCYKSHIYDYRSFNGQSNMINWVTFNNADVEYMYQICRFPWLTAMVCEYENTGDEVYAYRAIRQLMDFINDCGNKGNFQGGGPIGQYPRSLDTTERLVQLLTNIDALSESEYMTPDSLTAIMKHIWHMAEASRLNHPSSANWGQTIMLGLLGVANAFPEFSAAKGTNGSAVDWTRYAHNFNITLMENSYMADGTYIEPTGGYSSGAHQSYIGTYGTMKNQGYTVSDDAFQKLYNGTYYNLLSFAPGGMTYAYGDSGYSAGSAARRYAASDAIFEDPELQYIDSFGKLGKKPNWTSKNFPVGKYTFMRSDWSTKALYMATQVRGYEYGNHGHADRNQVVVAAYGKLLLTDAGSFTYTSGSLRELGRSTKMHNTVSINDQTQIYNTNASPEAIEEHGKIHSWKTTSAYDFLSQSTTATEGFDHKRTILFVKPHYWIVSDYIDPDDDSKENEIHQNWHMMPTAKMTVDSDKNILHSNNADGINIVVASADDDATATPENEGYWAQSIGSPVHNPYGYFNKKSKGDTTFDTALVPTNSADARVSVERLSTGTDTKTSTALKLVTNQGGKEASGYYYLSYEEQASETRRFDKFSTDGQMAFVHEDASGNPDMMIMHNAKFIRKDGRVILEAKKEISDISVSVESGKMYVSSSEEIALSDFKIYSPTHVKCVYVNDVRAKFSVVDGYVTSIGSDSEQSIIVGDIFEPIEIMYAPDFTTLASDPTDGGRITSNRNPQTVDTGGVLKLTSTTEGQSVWQFFFNQNKTNLSNGENNVYCIDFDIRKPDTSTAAYVQIGDSGDKMYRAYISGDSHVVPNTFTNIKFIVDTSTSPKKLIYLVDNQYATIADVGRNLQKFLVCTNASSYSYYIDNFSVYKISKEDFDGALDFFNLSEDAVLGENTSADKITTNLNLTDTLNWTSSNEDLISSTGIVSGDIVWQTEDVTLTASIGKMLSKELFFTVLRTPPPKSPGMVGEYYVYDDFEQLSSVRNGIVDLSGFGEFKNGKFYFTNNSSGESTFDYRFIASKEDTATIVGGSDVFVVEFDVKKELASESDRSSYYIRILTYNGYRYYAQTNVKASSSDALGQTGKSYYDSSVNHFKYVLDTINGTYSLYINGVLEIYESARNTRENPYVHLQGIKIVNQTPGSVISLDNLKVYRLGEKNYETGLTNHGITLLGEKKQKADTDGIYIPNFFGLETGLAKAPSKDLLPVCYVAKYRGTRLESLEKFEPNVVTYSEKGGVYGWWYPGAYADISESDVGNISIKAFVWDGLKPAGEHIFANALDE